MKKTCTIFLLLYISTHISFAQNNSGQLQKIKKIAVIGSAEIEIDPDEIYVNFDLKEYYSKQKIKTEITNIKKEFLDNCSKAGIAKEDIRVLGMGGNSYEDWYYHKRKSEPDFLATVNYIIKFNSTSLLDKLVPMLNDEATSNMYISKTAHSKIEDYRKQLKIQATQAAKLKAQYLAESIGEKIGVALFIEEVDGSSPTVYNRMALSNMAMESADGSGEPSTPFQKIKLRFEIHAEFELQ